MPRYRFPSLEPGHESDSLAQAYLTQLWHEVFDTLSDEAKERLSVDLRSVTWSRREYVWWVPVYDSRCGDALYQACIGLCPDGSISTVTYYGNGQDGLWVEVANPETT